MDFLAELGYLGLFLASFLAATILPLGSEVVLTALLLNDWNPAALVAVATVGNVLGAFVNYALGYWGSKLIALKVLRTSEEAFERAEARFRRYGLVSLLFAWVPVIGDPLTLVAGVLRVSIPWFFVLVATGKFLRYLAVSYWALT
jgi:membrane protein YqaA with SNARE-associated domain